MAMKITIDLLLFTIFLVLKLTGNVAWSWVWVTCPLWIPVAFAVAFFAVYFATAIVAEGISKLSGV